MIHDYEKTCGIFTWQTFLLVTNDNETSFCLLSNHFMAGMSRSAVVFFKTRSSNLVLLFVHP